MEFSDSFSSSSSSDDELKTMLNNDGNDVALSFLRNSRLPIVKVPKDNYWWTTTYPSLSKNDYIIYSVIKVCLELTAS